MEKEFEAQLKLTKHEVMYDGEPDLSHKALLDFYIKSMQRDFVRSIFEYAIEQSLDMPIMNNPEDLIKFVEDALKIAYEQYIYNRT